MGLIQSIKEFREYRAQKALSQMRFSGTQNAWTGTGSNSTWGDILLSWGFQQPGTKINFALEVGDLRNSSLVQAGVTWLARGLNSARPQIVELDLDNKETEIQDHPIPKLIRRPNPFYSGSALMTGMAASWIMAGEIYLLKVKGSVRDSSGVVMPGPIRELWYEPHWTIRPRWSESGNEFIGYYEIARNGKWFRIEKEDVIWIPNQVDPDTRRGTNGTAALMREYYTDQQAAQFSALLLRNGLVPPVVVSLGNKDLPFPAKELPVFRADLVRRMTGDTAGEPLVLSGPATVEKLGFDYSTVGMKEIRQIPEQRFCAAMGISAISLNLGAGKEMSTLANVREYKKDDYRACIVPLLDRIADELDNSLLPEFGGGEMEHCAWDYTKAPLMQPDRKVDAEIATMLYEKGVIKRSEAREAVGYEFGPEDDKYANEIGAALGASLLDEFERGGPEMNQPPEDDEDETKPNGQARVF